EGILDLKFYCGGGRSCGPELRLRPAKKHGLIFKSISMTYFWVHAMRKPMPAPWKGMPDRDGTDLRLDLSGSLLVVAAADAEAIQISRQDQFGASRLDPQGGQGIGAGANDIVMPQQVDLVTGDHRRQADDAGQFGKEGAKLHQRRRHADDAS